MSLILIGLIFLIVGIVAYALGANGVGGLSVEIGKWVMIVGLVLFVIFLLFGFLNDGGFHGSIRLP